MPEFVCKFANAQGQVRKTVETWNSEEDLRRDYSDRGLLIYSVKPHNRIIAGVGAADRTRLNLDQFVVFNQQFVTLTRAGLPILRSLALLAENTKNRKSLIIHS